MRAPFGFLFLLALIAPDLAQAGQSTHAATTRPAIAQPAIIEAAIAPIPVSPTASLRPTLSARSASTRLSGPPPIVARVGNRATVAADPATLCETAVTTAEYVNRLPPRLLGAISVTETGRVASTSNRTRPWPWTINAEGQGQFFDTKAQAIAATAALQANGVRSIDVGCLQVNLLYHPDAFVSLDQAFDPRANADYAAHFLNTLYAGAKDWPVAVAAYHSETPALGDAYRVLVMARWQNGEPHPPGTLPVTYGDFAQTGKAYGAKAYGDHAYAAFAPSTQVYGAFAPR